jgi:branched-chain amino acid transport system permease protein
VDAFLTSRIISDILEGLTNGVIYGLVALSLVLIWRSTGVLNFAQGAMAMFSTYVGMVVFANDFSYWPLVAIAVVVGFAMGGVTERVLVRTLYGKPEINPIVVMVGFLILLEAVAAAIWSTAPRGIPNPFSPIDWQLGGHPLALSAFSVYEIATAFVVMSAVAVLFRFTKLGLQLRASALSPEVSRLLGVRVGRMLTLGWILSTGVGSVSSVLVASNFFTGLTPQLMDSVFAFGFIAAAIGGLDSPVGAIVSGITLGIALQFVGDFVNSNAIILTALIVLIASLMLRPNGLFTKNAARRV